MPCQPIEPFISVDHLSNCLSNKDMMLIDLGGQQRYLQHHIPGAVHLPFAKLNRSNGDIGGLLPDTQALLDSLNGTGITASTTVIAYDDSGGGKAGRLFFTLDYLGHNNKAVLDGGWQAWQHAQAPICQQIPSVVGATAAILAQPQPTCVADAAYIADKLEDTDMQLWDTRSKAEFTGEEQRAARAGHIPGATHIEWTALMDKHKRLLPTPILRSRLEAAGITTDKEIVVYCQTHHRSAHSYTLLRQLGYERVRGYAGAWSDWATRSELPVSRG